MILAAITTHKRKPEMVERALKSVIAQTYTDWNCVVVDDSPADWPLRDDVRKMVETYAEKDSRICYVAHDRNYGVSHARNTALSIAYNAGGGGDSMSTYPTSMMMMNGCRRNWRSSLQNFRNAEMIQHSYTVTAI
ncbi:MAG: glycosyltransferase family 2 protein [Synergistaceae bacterium]|nr:glycosyltransferase family 2 protein [Synergistaceae bacterium]